MVSDLSEILLAQKLICVERQKNKNKRNKERRKQAQEERKAAIKKRQEEARKTW